MSNDIDNLQHLVLCCSVRLVYMVGGVVGCLFARRAKRVGRVVFACGGQNRAEAGMTKKDNGGTRKRHCTSLHDFKEFY